MTDKKTFADLLHLRSSSIAQHEAVSLPLTTSSVYQLSWDVGEGDQYARFGNPVWRAVEEQLTLLEGAPSLIFPSGMATMKKVCLLYTSPSPRDLSTSRMPSSA